MKNIAKMSSTLIFVLLTLLLIQRLLEPKYMTSNTMGALIGEYYKQNKNHDVLFVGDCEICTAFSPPYLWEKYGINSYVRGSVQQTIWQTYYLLEEMLQEEKPRVVIFNVAAMKYEKTYKSSFTRMTLDGMKWSGYKIKAIEESLLEEEHFIEYVFPILRYHDRWSNLTREDFEWYFKQRNVSFNGYMMFKETNPYQNEKNIREVDIASFSKKNYEYLDKLRKLCEKNGIKLILVKGPGIVPTWYSRWDNDIMTYAENNNLTYVNLIDRTGEVGIDYNTDTFSEGRHMNVFGAEKVTDYIGKILCEEYNVPNRHGETELEEYWNKELIYYKEFRD